MWRCLRVRSIGGDLIQRHSHSSLMLLSFLDDERNEIGEYLEREMNEQWNRAEVSRDELAIGLGDGLYSNSGCGWPLWLTGHRLVEVGLLVGGDGR